MSARYISEAHGLVHRRAGSSVHPNFKASIFYDGKADVSYGTLLPGNVVWFDGTGLYREGLNFGPTFQNVGPGNVLVEGSQMPKQYAERVKTDASLIDIMEGKWDIVDQLEPGGSVSTDGSIFSLFRITFLDGEKGEVTALTL